MMLKSGVAIIYCTEDRSDPKFAMISKMFMIDNRLLLGLKILDVIQYSLHYHSWIVEPTQQILVIPAGNIPTRQVLILRPIRGSISKQFFITLKYAF